jgi:acyl-CoA synthetase (AMP-forming)/AMP-acid ligase II
MDTLARSVKVSPKHRDDVWGLAYAPDRFAGMQVFLQAICNLNTIVSLLGLPPDQIHDAIDQYGVTHLSATPTLFRSLLYGNNTHEKVRSITVGGEVCHPHLKTELRHVFPNAQFRNIYASTESGAVFNSDGDSFIVSDEMKDLVRIDHGQLWIHSSLVAESLRKNCIDSFLCTGDEVEIVHQSPLTLRVLARESDWINVGGFKVNPHEVESALLQIEGVAEARVYPQKNSVVGYLVCAEVVLKNGVQFSVADIRRILSSRLDHYSIPRIIQFVNEIGISASGKKGRTA